MLANAIDKRTAGFYTQTKVAKYSRPIQKSQGDEIFHPPETILQYRVNKIFNRKLFFVNEASDGRLKAKSFSCNKHRRRDFILQLLKENLPSNFSIRLNYTKLIIY